MARMCYLKMARLAAYSKTAAAQFSHFGAKIEDRFPNRSDSEIRKSSRSEFTFECWLPYILVFAGASCDTETARRTRRAAVIRVQGTCAASRACCLIIECQDQWLDMWSANEAILAAVNTPQDLWK
jgi:hypothetical protein